MCVLGQEIIRYFLGRIGSIMVLQSLRCQTFLTVKIFHPIENPKKLREKKYKIPQLYMIYVMFSFPNIGGLQAVNSKILLNNKNYDIFIYALYTLY